MEQGLSKFFRTELDAERRELIRLLEHSPPNSPEMQALKQKIITKHAELVAILDREEALFRELSIDR